MSGTNTCRREPWPPGCCVAAFIDAALTILGQKGIDRKTLARSLDTRVGADDPNPCDLKVEPDPFLRGVTADKAVAHLPRILKESDPHIAFRHIRFAEITLGLVEDVLAEGEASGCVMGVGLNLGPFIGRAGVVRHVCRIHTGTHAEDVILFDDSSGDPSERRVIRWMELLPRVFEVDDGFWCLGEQKALGFRFAPSWPCTA